VGDLALVIPDPRDPAHDPEPPAPRAPVDAMQKERRGPGAHYSRPGQVPARH
jgi:hypothetical protein